MQKKAILYLIFTFLLFACSPQVEPNSVGNGESSENETALSPVESEDETAVTNPEPSNSEAVQEDDESMTETNENDEPIVPEETPAISRDNIASESNEQKSEPVVVDLSTLMTPEPSGDEEPIEQPAPGIPDGTAKLINDVQQDLSSQLNIDISSIETISVEEVMWRDSSLGCPVDGMSYLQVLTSGFRIILEVDGQEYHYHSRDTSNFVLCRNPQSPIPGGEPAPGLDDT